MRVITRLLLLICAVCLGAAASAEPFGHPSFGRFRPDMSVAQAMAAAPDLQWRTYPARSRTRIGGASAPAALEFAGGLWDLEVGDLFGMSDPSLPGLYDVYKFNMKRTQPVSRPAECFAQLNGIIATLEPLYGAFGGHPAFPHGDNMLYGSVYGPFAVRSVGARSRVRDYGAEHGMQPWTTFAEVDEASGVNVLVKADYFIDSRACDLRVDISHSPERAARAAKARAKYASR